MKGEQAQRHKPRRASGKLVGKTCVSLFVWFAYCLFRDRPYSYTENVYLLLQFTDWFCESYINIMVFKKRDEQIQYCPFILVSGAEKNGL